MAAMVIVNTPGSWSHVYWPLLHAEWHGWTPTDLIFPFFVFIVGVSLVFSLSRLVQQSGKATALKRILRRSLLLYVIGIFYYGGFTESVERIRWLGVLQRIALCYLFAGILFCTLKRRGLVIACVALLTGYWALMTFVPIRDISLEKKNLEHLSVQAGTTNADNNGDGGPGYIPTARAYLEGGYEPTVALARRLSGRMHKQGNTRSALNFEERAAELEKRVDVLRRVLMDQEVIQRPQLNPDGKPLAEAMRQSSDESEIAQS